MKHSTDIKIETFGWDLESAKKKIDLRLGREIWHSGVESQLNLQEREASVSATNIYANSHAAELVSRAVRTIKRGSGTIEHYAVTKEK